MQNADEHGHVPLFGITARSVTKYGPPSPRVPAECQPGAVGPHPPPGCPNR